jgi:hypothetical protein
LDLRASPDFFCSAWPGLLSGLWLNHPAFFGLLFRLSLPFRFSLAFASAFAFQPHLFGRCFFGLSFRSLQPWLSLQLLPFQPQLFGRCFFGLSLPFRSPWLSLQLLPFTAAFSALLSRLGSVPLQPWLSLRYSLFQPQPFRPLLSPWAFRSASALAFARL